MIDERLCELDATRVSSPYGKQKSQLVLELEIFLAALTPAGSLLTCHPRDIVRFLVWKDRKGQTKVHAAECPRLGSNSSHTCPCPTRLAAGTVDSTIGKLRAIFNNMGRAGDYDIRSGEGNPAAHFSVRQYLQSVQKEQSSCRVVSRQATPVFFDKFLKLVRHLRDQLVHPSTTPIYKYILARDLTFFALEFLTGQRASDLGRLKTVDIRLSRDQTHLLILQRVGKAVRGTAPRPVSIRALGNTEICPIANLQFYRQICIAMGIDLSTGFLFRTTTNRKAVSTSPFLAAAAQARLVTYLTSLGLYTNETVHGFRAGTAILLTLLGASKDDVAKHVGWCSSLMVNHYTRERRVPPKDDVWAKLDLSTSPGNDHPQAAVLGAEFQARSDLTDFEPFFTQP